MTVSRIIQIFRQRLRSLFRKERLDDDLDRELLFHFEQLVQENIEAGMSAEEARRAARLALGNTSVLAEECRDERRVSWYHDFVQDVRYGVRLMRRQAGFTAIAALSLALGIGGNTALLSAGRSLFMGGLPFPDDGRLVVIRSAPIQNPQLWANPAVPDYVAWKEGTRTFEAMGLSIANHQDLGGEDSGFPPERIIGQSVTPSIFAALKVQPQLGRVFREDEAPTGNPAPVIILSHQLWQRRFGGDRTILGKDVRLTGRNMKVVGVMPPDFRFANQESEFLVPLAPNKFQLRGSARLFAVTGRLKEGVSLGQAQADVAAVSAQLARDDPERRKDWGAQVVPLRWFWFGWIGQALLTLETGVLLVLLIACANVSTLLLARIPARQPEIAMRLSMGAGRGRIVRQFLTESLLLSSIAGVPGVLIAWWGVHSLGDLKPNAGGMPLSLFGQDFGIIGIAALLALISSVLFGFLPALVAFSTGTDLRQSSVHGRRRNPFGALVSVQVGLALMLLISSGLLINSFVRLVLDDRGFDPKGILTFEYRIPVQIYSSQLGSFRGMPAMEATPPTAAIQRVHERLRALPGADSVAGVSARPVNGLALPSATLLVEGRPLPETAAERTQASMTYFLVTDNFFETMRTPIVRGRDFGPQDTAAAPWVAVINETAAKRLWPDEDPIGKRFTVDAMSGERSREVIGVVRDVPLRYVNDGSRQAVAYTSYLQQPERYQGVNTGMFGQMTFLVRGADLVSLATAARAAVAEVDPARPLANIQTLSDFVEESLRTRRYYVSALSVFAFMATVLAAVGVYGVMTFSVSQRTREIGIRMAMGASKRDIIQLVGGSALRLVAIGLAFGFLGSLVLARLLAGQLWGVSSTDPATFIGVTVLLLAVAMAAWSIPARKAIRLEPTEALRTE
jgi:predicted permease